MVNHSDVPVPQFGRKTKMKLLKSNVLSVLLYGRETWKMTKGDEKILDIFLKIYWPENFKIRIFI
jgi:hypothetical protein